MSQSLDKIVKGLETGTLFCMHNFAFPLSDTGIPVYRYGTGNGHRYRYTATEHGYRYLYRYLVYRRALLFYISFFENRDFPVPSVEKIVNFIIFFFL